LAGLGSADPAALKRAAEWANRPATTAPLGRYGVAEAISNHAAKAIEIEDIEARVSALEASVAGERRGQFKGIWVPPWTVVGSRIVPLVGPAGSGGYRYATLTPTRSRAPLAPGTASILGFGDVTPACVCTSTGTTPPPGNTRATSASRAMPLGETCQPLDAGQQWAHRSPVLICRLSARR
jgi:hypothetical protein